MKQYKPGDYILRDCASISSGTLAGLTGERSYAELDRIQGLFVQWVIAKIDVGTKFKNWHDAWFEFIKE